MDENYGLFVVNMSVDDICGQATDNLYMGKFDDMRDFFSKINLKRDTCHLYSLEDFFNRLNNDMINVDATYSQVIQLKK